MHSLCNRSLVLWILSNCKVAKYNNEDVIVLNLDPKSPRLIKPEVLRIIHGNPRGTAEVPKDILECPDVEPVDLRNFILDANPENSGKFFITISQIKEACSAARRDGDIRMEVRLFLSALFNFSSFTTSALYLTQKNEEYVLDMKKIATNDWCKLLFDHLKLAIKKFQDSDTVWSPVSFLVSIFEIFVSFFRIAMLLTNHYWQIFFLGQLGLRCNHWQLRRRIEDP